MSLTLAAEAVYEYNEARHGRRWCVRDNYDPDESIVMAVDRFESAPEVEKGAWFLEVWVAALTQRVCLVEGRDNISQLMSFFFWEAAPEIGEIPNAMQRLRFFAKNNSNYDLINTLISLTKSFGHDEITLSNAIVSKINIQNRRTA